MAICKHCGEVNLKWIDHSKGVGTTREWKLYDTKNLRHTCVEFFAWLKNGRPPFEPAAPKIPLPVATITQRRPIRV